MLQEARSLQSATSFLNGVSAARRRTESAAGNRRNSEFRLTDETGTTAFTDATYTSSYPSTQSTYAAPSSAYASQTYLAVNEADERRRGSEKQSGYAYSRPLTLTQLKCYRNHAKLMSNRNKHASVECAVCHVDDEFEHFTCTWCALRMCKFCRKDFHERGLAALKERIRNAELGDAANSSAESLTHAARKAFV